jgi:hypothetical protein
MISLKGALALAIGLPSGTLCAQDKALDGWPMFAPNKVSGPATFRNALAQKNCQVPSGRNDHYRLPTLVVAADADTARATIAVVCVRVGKQTVFAWHGLTQRLDSLRTTPIADMIERITYNGETYQSWAYGLIVHNQDELTEGFRDRCFLWTYSRGRWQGKPSEC